MQIAIVGISRELEACLIVEYTRYKIGEKRRAIRARLSKSYGSLALFKPLPEL